MSIPTSKMAWMEDEVFMAYTTYSVIVIVKMMLMSLMTAYFRITKGVSINQFKTFCFKLFLLSLLSLFFY